MNKNFSIPEFKTEAGEALQGVVSNDGYLTGYVGVTEDEVCAYLKSIEDAGYTVWAKNEIKNNRYTTYTKGEDVLYLGWQADISTLRIYAGSGEYLPELEAPEYQKVTEPTLTSLKLTETPGMLYIIQAEDGVFTIIDGGCNSEEDKKRLMDFLNERKPETHQKPRVNWILTHLHYDHVSLAVRFLEAYGEQIELETVTYNFPDVASLIWASSYTTEEAKRYAIRVQEWYKNINSLFPNTKTFVHHTGQKLVLAGCEVEFLFTQEDWWPNKCQTFNDTTSVMRINFKSGHSFLCMSDLDEKASDIMANIYGDYLRTDVLQPNHHGQKGGTNTLYRLFKPKYVFWANTKEHCITLEGDIYTAVIHHELRSKFNPILFSSPTIEGHYHAEQTVIINMDTLTVTDENGDRPVSFWSVKIIT
jgi:beta-lactamase superfamily II metal-dependent hydrolase